MSLQLPSGAELKEFLNLQAEVEIEDLIAKTLLNPLRDLFERPRKDIRGQLVHLGFDISIKESADPSSLRNLKNLCQEACEILEILHAGSLVVDDIQDGSQYRRGKRSLHTIYGLPVALNAGNWLYFLPSKKIQELDASESCKTLLLQECQRTLLLGHYGQALDVGISVDALEQARVSEVSRAAMELKSGALAGFALKMGGLLAEAQEPLVARLEIWGRKIGVALQMFDDIGNIVSRANPEKCCEDLKHKKLGHILSTCAKEMSAEEFSSFLRLMETLPESLPEVLLSLEKRSILEKARKEACEFIKTITREMTLDLNLYNGELARLEAIAEKLVRAYE